MVKENYVFSGSSNKPIILDQTFNDEMKNVGVVVFCHGFKGFKDWGHFNKVAELFADAGFVFLKFNFSHNGTSPEFPSDFVELEAFGNNNFTKELDDLGIVLDWVEKNESSKGNGLPIYLMGHSRGGGIAVLKTHEDKRVKKLVTWAAVGDFGSRFVGDLNQFKEEGVYYIYNGRTKQEMPLYYQFYEDFITNKNRLDVPHAAGKIQIPFLIIHGTGDEAVPCEDALTLHGSNSQSKLLLIENAGHTFGARHPFKDTELPKYATEVVNASIEFLLDKIR